MATKSIDRAEWEYLKSCADKLRRIIEILEEEAPTLRPEASEVGVPTAKAVGKKQPSLEDKLREIRKILKE